MQNTIGDKDYDVEVEVENNVEGVSPEIIVNVWYEKLSEWIEFDNEKSQGIVDDLADV